MKYEFEKIDNPTISTEVMAGLTPVLLSLLAKLIVDKDENKKEKLFQLLDKALEWNKDLPASEQIALAGQVTKASLSGKQ